MKKKNPVVAEKKSKGKIDIPYTPRMPAQNIIAKLDGETWADIEELNIDDGRFVLVHRFENENEQHYYYQNDSPEALRAQAIRFDWNKKNYYIIDLETMEPYQNNPIVDGRIYDKNVFNKYRAEIIEEFKNLGFTDLFINESRPDKVYIVPKEQWREARDNNFNDIREDKEMVQDLLAMLDEE